MTLLIILVILISIIIGIHMGYLLLLRNVSWKKLTKFPGDISADSTLLEKHSVFPFISVVIPVYNEEKVIERRINNIFDSAYPGEKMEVIIVDSGSKDRTKNIVQEKFGNRVILIQEKERRGKAHAINLAMNVCKGEIVVVTDAPTLYSHNTINQLVASLGSSSVGAVTALYEIPNASENQITSSEHAYWAYKDKIRILESRAHSTSWLSGEACAFKKKIVSRVDEDTLADDSNIALQTLSKGYRVFVNEKCFFSEKSPSDFYDYFRIKTRRTLGGLIETLRFKSLLFNPSYGHFGLMIFPYRFFVQFINPVLTLATITIAIFAILEVATDFGIFALILAAPLLYFGLRFKYRIISYIYLQLISLIAVLMLLTKRIRVDWAQSKTTRVVN